MKADNERREMICARVEYWARRLNVHPRRIRVQPMMRKWGSCSTSGTVTFAADLVNQRLTFQDFVIAHELLHLRVPNHGRLYKALLAAYVPDWRRHESRELAGR